MQTGTRPVRLCVRPDVPVPMTLGVRAPLVVLPPSLTDEPEPLRLALLHELAHVRHGDAALVLATRLVRALAVGHPLAHLLGRRLGLLAELACDAAVLAEDAQARRAYGHLLARFAGPGPALAPTLAARPSQVRQRLMRLRQPLLLARGTGATVLLGSLLLGALVATGFLAVEAAPHAPLIAPAPVTPLPALAEVRPALPQSMRAAPAPALPAPAVPAPAGPSAHPESPASRPSTPQPDTAMNRSQQLLTTALLAAGAALPAAAQTTTPIPATQATPVWPAGAREDSVEGRVTLKVYVGSDGRVATSRRCAWP